MNVKRMDIKEFRDKGYLQELNRKFLHPLGLALEVIIDNMGEKNESVKLGGIWDYREDEEGIIFSDDIDEEKVKRIEDEWKRRKKIRVKKLGYMIQSLKRNKNVHNNI